MRRPLFLLFFLLFPECTDRTRFGVENVSDFSKNRKSAVFGHDMGVKTCPFLHREIKPANKNQ